MVDKCGAFLRKPKLLNTKAVVIPLQTLHCTLLHLTPSLQVNAVLLLFISATMTILPLSTTSAHYSKTFNEDTLKTTAINPKEEIKGPKISV